MLTELKVIAITCDSCGKIAPCCEENGHCHTVLMPRTVSDADVGLVRREVVADDDWSEDGEGLIHCPACPTLQLTEDAKAERARERERSGLTLFELEGTPS